MKNQKETIRKTVGNLNNEESDGGGWWLPNIQRPFVEDDQIERLFDSIAAVSDQHLRYGVPRRNQATQVIDKCKHSLWLSDFYVPSDSKVKRLVLDGQHIAEPIYRLAGAMVANCILMC